jgi:hypothetical protein
MPVRVIFNWDERKPGFFEFDRVAHCGADASGQFCQTLTGADADSGGRRGGLRNHVFGVTERGKETDYADT